MVSPAGRQRSGILGFFLLAGAGFTAVGIYLLIKGLSEDSLVGSSGSTIAGGTFTMIGVIWVLVALGVGAYYRRVRERQAEEAQLFQTGERATAVIEGVEGTGAQINDQPQVYLTLRVKPRHGQEFIHQRKVVLPFGSVVQPGHLVDVAYDPANPERVALDVDDRYAATPPAIYIRTRPPEGAAAVTPATSATVAPAAPAAASGSGDPPTLIEQLERLARLRDSGALTQAEFDAQKRELLGG